MMGVGVVVLVVAVRLFVTLPKLGRMSSLTARL